MNLRTSVVCLFILGIQLKYAEGTHHHHGRIFYNAVSGSSFDNLHQHIPLAFKFPRRPPLIDVNNIVRFNLYTRQNPYTPQILETSNGATGQSTNFRADKKTKILIHGFIDSASDSTAGDWLNDMRDAYLNNDDINVVVMDYSIVALFLFYWTNLPELSAGRLAELVYFLNKSGASYDSFHLIGRSWGCHVAGMTGRKFSGRLGRITGLDPTNPYKSVGISFRLDRTDAQFVDVYHLNGKNNRFLFLNIIGMMDQYDGLFPPTGTVDIYPNYQQRQITGCPIVNASLYTPSCQLGLGARLFIETIKRSNAFPVCFCESFLKYLRGECKCDTRNLMYMGNYMPMTATGIYQLADTDNTIQAQQVHESTETVSILMTSTSTAPTSSSSTTSNSTQVEPFQTSTEVSTSSSTTATEIPTTATEKTTTATASASTTPSNQTAWTVNSKEVGSTKPAEGRQSTPAKVVPRTSKVTSLT